MSMRYDRYQDIYFEEPCFVHDNAKVGRGVTIGMFSYVGENARIADGTNIPPCTFVYAEYPPAPEPDAPQLKPRRPRK